MPSQTPQPAVRSQDTAPEREYLGQSLGRPEKGPGSMARVPRRILALLIDWYLCFALVWLVFGNLQGRSALLVSLIFWIYQSLLVGLSGHTLGHWVCGMQVQFQRGAPVTFGVGTLRSLLVALALPVVMVDRDGRGLQDHVKDTVLVRFR